MFHPLPTIALWLAALPLLAASLPNRPVAALDMHRYAGQWHEIARLPMYFERHCLGAVTATYTPAPDGDIRIHNTCLTRSGGQSAEATARTTPDQPGVLDVRFTPAWLSWLPLARAEYWVIEVDADYRWAVIGSPDRKHLWILARRPALEHALCAALAERARQRGYPVDQLIVTASLE